jgi:hypothetical protein
MEVLNKTIQTPREEGGAATKEDNASSKCPKMKKERSLKRQ